ncbi:MAG TPA: hypothetical protein VEL31_05145 [Ktedonobacteraceae bacterium]|nr:hypothetical protein [Ktedonobacteraceae bacterium]
MSENLDSEQRARLWGYRLHVENQLYSRLTVFLTYETILLAVVGTLYNNPNSARNVLIVLVVLGVLITLIWLYVRHNVKQVFVILDFRTYDTLPEHKETVDKILNARKWESKLGIRTPALSLLTYAIPILILLVWLFLLLFLLQWLP